MYEDDSSDGNVLESVFFILLISVPVYCMAYVLFRMLFH